MIKTICYGIMILIVANVNFFCTPPPPKPVKYLHPIFEYTVLWGTPSKVIFTQCARPAPQLCSLFTPQSAQVDTLFADLVKMRGEIEPKLQAPLEEYRYQIAGYNAMLLYVNAFAIITDKGLIHWKTDGVVSCDTGNTYFGAIYNVAERRFDLFMRNGDKETGK